MNKIKPTATNDTAARPAEFDKAVMAYMPGLKKLAARYVPRAYQDDLVVNTIMHTREVAELSRAGRRHLQGALGVAGVGHARHRQESGRYCHGDEATGAGGPAV